MFVVKRRSEVIRFGIFLVLAGLLAYYVAGKYVTWQSARGDGGGHPTTTGPIIAGPQGVDLAQRAVDSGDGSDFFAETRMDRDRNRGALRASLKVVMEDPNTDPDVRKQATQQFLAVGNQESLEERAEAMVKAKGFADALVSLSESSAQVVVKGKGISQQQFMQVVDMVSTITGVKAAAVVVIPRDH
ncbi:MAG TPA: SpoIIIAH-like family protein [Symbiobacteriaceae bacterium]|jgi:stage III sporulation protein AH